MTPRHARRLASVLAGVAGMLLAGGCGLLLPEASAPPSFYALDAVSAVPRLRPPPPVADAASPTLIVDLTRAAPGYDSPNIVYVRIAHQQEHYARSEWVDTPARMLTPLLVSALQGSGEFRAVGQVASGIAGDLRLDTQIVRLQQEFGGGPSRVRFTLRVMLSDSVTRQVISWRDFDEVCASASEDTYGGVVAANRAVQLVMEQLASYCAQVAGQWRASHAAAPRAAQTHPPPH